MAVVTSMLLEMVYDSRWLASHAGCKFIVYNDNLQTLRDVAEEVCKFDGARWEPSKRRVVWPNGSVAYLLSEQSDSKGFRVDALVYHDKFPPVLGDAVRP